LHGYFHDEVMAMERFAFSADFPQVMSRGKIQFYFNLVHAQSWQREWRNFAPKIFFKLSDNSQLVNSILSFFVHPKK